MMQFPVAKAIGIVQKGTIIGKLKGTTLATIPTGTRSSRQVTPVPTSRNRPVKCEEDGRPIAHSRVSNPFRIEALA